MVNVPIFYQDYSRIENCLRQLEREKHLQLIEPEAMSDSATSKLEPERVFHKLDNYLLQVNRLNNLEPSNKRQMITRTMGVVSISEEVGHKKIELVKDGSVLYQAHKTTDEWTVSQNQLDNSQLETIYSLPENKEEILLDFHSRNLTTNLKNIFKEKGYPVSVPISLNSTQVPYSFEISAESTKNQLVLLGKNRQGDEIFQSHLDSTGTIKVVRQEIPLEHISQLSQCTDLALDNPFQALEAELEP